MGLAFGHGIWPVGGGSSLERDLVSGQVVFGEASLGRSLLLTVGKSVLLAGSQGGTTH